MTVGVSTLGVTGRRLRLLACLGLLCALAACAGGGGGYSSASRGRAHYSPGRTYTPPGPPSDPWGPYVNEAASRYQIPARWIREVMRQESGGKQQAVSWVGAMGLMQLMPDTYEGLRVRYGLGDDPFDPHNNILAGAAYIKEMYDRYGSPAFLAAYNAGPNRLDRYLAGSSALPNETVNYLASIAPRLGTEVAMTGPLSAYALGGGGTVADTMQTGQSVSYAMASQPVRPAARAYAAPSYAVASAAPVRSPTPAGCDPDAAYNPGQPCTPMAAAPVQTAAYAAPAYSAPVVAQLADASSASGCDPDAAYDPNRRCQYAPQTAGYAPAGTAQGGYASAVYTPPPTAPRPRPQPAPVAVASAMPSSRFHLVTPAAADTLPGTMASRYPGAAVGGGWSVQVGAFNTAELARREADRARGIAPDVLGRARTLTPTTSPFGGNVLYRARLTDLSEGAATTACVRLSSRQQACMVVPPG